MVDNVAFWLYQIISVAGFDTSFFSIQYFLVLSSFIFFFLWWKETIYGFQRFISLITNKFWFMVICLLYPCSCVCKNLCYTILSFFFKFIIFRQLFNLSLNLVTSGLSLPLHPQISFCTWYSKSPKAISKGFLVGQFFL